MTKPLHGQFLRQRQEATNSKSGAWLALANVKKETEGLLIAAEVKNYCHQSEKQMNMKAM